MTFTIIRILDITFSFSGLLCFSPALAALTVAGLFDTGSPIFKQVRVGLHQKPFTLFKFRTMSLDTASVASHLASAAAITPFGRFLRKTKLDELPQLWNVLKGEMSLVGPRPGLFNQTELTQARQKRGVYRVRPGITGQAQVTGVDMSTPVRLAEIDREMISGLTVIQYLKLIVQTVTGKGAGDVIQ